MANLKQLTRLLRQTPRPARWFVGIGMIGLISALLAMWPQIRNIADLFLRIHPSAQSAVLLGLCAMIIFNAWNLFNYYRRLETTEEERDKLTAKTAELKHRLARSKKRMRDAIAEKVTAEEEIQNFIRGEEDVWAKPLNGADLFIPRESRKAVFVAAFNLKGGVGKTTLTANLGACFSKLRPHYNVVLIDLDPQGTLSTYAVANDMLVFQWNNDNTALRLLEADMEPTLYSKLLTPSRGAEKLHVIVSNDRLDRADFRCMASFFLNGQRDEVRFRFQQLHSVPSLLHEPTLVLFDCPPRLTTSAVNALTCCDHVIVPTKLDDNSVPAVPRAISVIEKKLHALIRGKARVSMLKVIATMLPVAPLLFLAVLFWARADRDLSIIFFCGTAAFLVIGAALVWSGLQKHRPNRAWLGAGLLFSALLAFGAVALSGLLWIGKRERLLLIVVTEAGTEKPVPGALVRVFNEFAESGSEKRTDTAGKAEFNFSFTAAGESSLVHDTGDIYIWPVSLKIAVDGYQEANERLGRFVDSPQTLYGPPLPVVQVKLKRSKKLPT